MAHLYGYARVSTGLQDPALQLDALNAAGCARIFTDKASGKLDRRPQQDQLLEVVLPGDGVAAGPARTKPETDEARNTWSQPSRISVATASGSDR